MDWSLRLSETPLTAVQVLDGDPPLVSAWITRQEVHFYAQEDGTYWGGLDLSDGSGIFPNSDNWSDFLEGLRAPNGLYLPSVDLGHTLVLTSNDGRLRLYLRRESQQLILDADGIQTPLEHGAGTEWASVGLDRELGTIGALDKEGFLHIYQQHIDLGSYPTDQSSGEILVPDESGVIILVGPEQFWVFNTAGQVEYRAEASAPVGLSAVAPDGSRILVADRDQDVLRVYNARLRLLRQQSARDLLAMAEPLDGEEEPFFPISPDTLSVSSSGQIAFGLGGRLCCTHINRLSVLPQTKRLF